MIQSNELVAHYVALAKHPIAENNFSGVDIRYSSDYEQLEVELEKAAAPHATSGIDWPWVRATSETLLSRHSKDLRVATWLTWSLYQCESLAGLRAGLALLHTLCDEYWDSLHPAKPRTRAAALGWLPPRLAQLVARPPAPGQQDVLAELGDILERLDRCLVQHLGDAAPALAPLCQHLREHLAHTPPPPSVHLPTTENPPPVSSHTPDNDKEAQQRLRQLQDQARPLCAYWLRHNVADLRALRLSRALLWLSIDSLPACDGERLTALRGLPADRLAGYRERLQQGASAELLGELEASLARAPFWLDGHRLVWHCLQALNAPAAIPVDSLLYDDELALENLARQVRQRLHEIHAELRVSVPVYLVLSKADKVLGFDAFFDQLTREESDQVLGASFRQAQNGTDAAVVRQEFEELLRRLNSQVILRLHQERDTLRRGRILDFPQQLSQLGERLCLLVELAFSGNRYQRASQLRGFYLTSAPELHDPLDPSTTGIGRNLGLAGSSLPTYRSGRARFIHQLLSRVIFPEAELAGLDDQEVRRIGWRQRALYAGAATSLLLCGLLWGNSYVAIADFREFFKRDGVADSFVERYLKAFLSDSEGQYQLRRLDGQGLPLSPGFLMQISHIQVIRRSFFAENPGEPLVLFKLEPFALDYSLNRADFRIGGQQLEYRHGPIVATAFRWPAEGESDRSSLVLEEQGGRRVGIERNSGPWSLFRLLDLMQVGYHSGRDVLLLKANLDGLQAKYLLLSQRAPNPFDAALLRGFKLPAML